MSAPAPNLHGAARVLQARVLESITLLASRIRVRPALSDADLYECILTFVLRDIVRRYAEARELTRADSGLWSLRLFRHDPAWPSFDEFGLETELDELLGERTLEQRASERIAYAELPLELIGSVYENSLPFALEHDGSRFHLTKSSARRQSGSFYTPSFVAKQVVSRALAQVPRSSAEADPWPALGVCDPALGGGVFLLEVCRQLAAKLAGSSAPAVEGRGSLELLHVATHCVSGVDSSRLAVAIAEASLWLLIGQASVPASVFESRLRVADALTDERSLDELLRVCARDRSFDLVIGNPPWVAFAGRAAQPLCPKKRAFYRSHFQAFRGYPTLHALFIERSAKLAPNGAIALVIPSPVADLDGYAAVRRTLTATHRVCEPLLEFGQDAFAGVTQPCFALIARADTSAAPTARPWRLSERQHALASAERVEVPALLERLSQMPSLPAELFGEMGFQSTRIVSEQLFWRGNEPNDKFRYPLLEGRDVNEFRQRPPRLFLCDDARALQEARCRLRRASEYGRVAFVVRQTAAVTIAALHGGLPFRNSLLAGFAHAEYSPELMVALLNSALYRALHISRQRDARQAAFPQVKIRHLRALPAPPRNVEARARLEAITREATRAAVSDEVRAALDEEVFTLFEATAEERRQVRAFLHKLAPKWGYSPAQ